MDAALVWVREAVSMARRSQGAERRRRRGLRTARERERASEGGSRAVSGRCGGLRGNTARWWHCDGGQPGSTVLRIRPRPSLRFLLRPPAVHRFSGFVHRRWIWPHVL